MFSMWIGLELDRALPQPFWVSSLYCCVMSEEASERTPESGGIRVFLVRWKESLELMAAEPSGVSPLREGPEAFRVMIQNLVTENVREEKARSCETDSDMSLTSGGVWLMWRRDRSLLISWPFCCPLSEGDGEDCVIGFVS